MKNSIIRQCLDIFKHEDIKNELKLLINPLVEFIFYEIKPYIYIGVALIALMFIMLFTILIMLVLLLRNKELIQKLPNIFR